MEFVSQPVSLEADQRTKRRRRGLLALLLSLSLLTLGTGVFSLAVFTSTDTSSGSFTTGTIVLGVTPAPLFTVTGILPGDSGSATLTVANNGSGALRYALTSTSTGGGTGLAGQLNMSIKVGTCPGSGTALYAGVLNGASFGSAAQGPDLNDQDILSGATQKLCFAWDLPLGTNTSFQSATTTATFTFVAEQTANNP